MHANATSDIDYEVGNGPLHIPYPPSTFSNTWSSGCGNITARLVEYNQTLATLYDDEIVVDIADESYIGERSDLVF